MGCFGSKTAPAQMGETNIALIGVSGQGKTTYCKELAQIFTFDLPQEEKDGTNRFKFEFEFENQKERVNMLSTSGEDIMERTKMGLFGQSDVFFVFISVNSENRQFIKDNLVDIYVYFDKLKQSQHNGKTYLVATKVDLRKSDKNCVTDTEIKEKEVGGLANYYRIVFRKIRKEKDGRFFVL